MAPIPFGGCLLNYTKLGTRGSLGIHNALPVFELMSVVAWLPNRTIFAHGKVTLSLMATMSFRHGPQVR